MKQTPADREHEARTWARAAAEKPEQPLRLSCSSCLFSDKDLGDRRQRDGRHGDIRAASIQIIKVQSPGSRSCCRLETCPQAWTWRPQWDHLCGLS